MYRILSIAVFCVIYLGVVGAMADTFGSGGSPVTLDFVSISGSTNPTSGYGIVNNDFRMGKFEITCDQYDKFAASLGVPVTGYPTNAYNTGRYYTGASLPMHDVSWYEAAQFVNWLNTSTNHPPAYKFSGTQGTSSYTFSAWASSDPGYNASNPYRNSNAYYFLPTENEWVKAAYWSGTKLQTYATIGDVFPTQGTLAGTGWTGWNYCVNGNYVPYPATLPAGPWNIGTGSQELNGTYDMMGNVWEWMEGPFANGDYGSNSSRGMRGGGWWGDAGASFTATSYRNNYIPTAYDRNLGFRVASVPEPSTIMLLIAGGLGLLGYAWRKRKASILTFVVVLTVAWSSGVAQADVFNLGGTRNANGSWAGLASLEMVTVGNAGNTGELSGAGAGGAGPNAIVGAVDYTYNIGKYEVTTSQYTAFLNAVAKTDTYGLYHTEMWSYDAGCKIQRSGSPGSYSYSITADRANRPVNCVEWSDAVRFCNWLQNGQPTGTQDLSTTEDGSYYLNGVTSDSALMAVRRNACAGFVIPTEDEWHKAAYHKNDGVTGNYWDYATGTNTVPTNVLGNPDPGNTATFAVGPPHSGTGLNPGSPYYCTDVGDHENSESSYGTFDQSGNVFEWNETVVYDSMRGIRGGDWLATAYSLSAAGRENAGGPTGISGGSSRVGFRVASVPEPSTFALLGIGALGLLGWVRQRRTQSSLA